MNLAEYNQESLYCCLLDQKYLASPQVSGLFSFWFLVIRAVLDIGSVSHSRPKTPTSFMLPFSSMFSRKDCIVDQRVCCWIGGSFSFQQPAEYLPLAKNKGIKILFRCQLNLSMFNKLCGCCLHQCTLAFTTYSIKKENYR